MSADRIDESASSTLLALIRVTRELKISRAPRERSQLAQTAPTCIGRLEQSSSSAVRRVTSLCG
eukprot:scaffold160180_cov36-Tisochrysis_lutea.AAC.2